MEWPSTRVPQGGIFQTPKVKYNPETKKFLQDLMEESKLTMFQRKKENYNLRSNDSLPSSSSKLNKNNSNHNNVIIKNGYSRRRNFNSIVESGAYTREPFVPKQRGVDREFAKKHLQDFMAFGKEVKTDKPKCEEKEMPELNRFDQIKQEIKERVDWLAEMEELGEGHKYKTVIEQQIAARVREMGLLKAARDKPINGMGEK